MNISICITVFNEGDNLEALLDSLLCQSKKPDEIIVVDGGSTDKTLSVINNFQLTIRQHHFVGNEFPNINFHLIKRHKATRSEGRNLAVKAAKNEIIAITDAGCIAHRDWLEKITQPFEQSHPRGVHSATSGESFGVDISAGFYKMAGKNSLQKAMGVFLGITPDKFTDKFLPSTRSMAFTKTAWKKVGGFPESKENSAEDTDFNYKAIKTGLKYARVKNAIVEWGMPDSIFEFEKKIYDYAKWDAQYGIWWHPTQRFASHNIKVLLIFSRYIFGIVLLTLWLNGNSTSLLLLLITLFMLYLIYPIYKGYDVIKDWKGRLWLPVIQISSDFAVMIGFVSGIIKK